MGTVWPPGEPWHILRGPKAEKKCEKGTWCLSVCVESLFDLGETPQTWEEILSGVQQKEE